VQSINTRKKMQLHRPTAHFSSHQRGVYYARIKICNTLPASFAESVKDKKRCILVLKTFLTAESLYSNSEYLNYQHEINNGDCFMRKALQTLYIFCWILCPLVLIQDFLVYNYVFSIMPCFISIHHRAYWCMKRL